MRITPVHGVLRGPEGECPPVPFITVDDEEGESLIARGIARKWVEDEVVKAEEPEPVVEPIIEPAPTIDNENPVGAPGEDVIEAIELLEDDDFVKAGPRKGRPKIESIRAIVERDVTTEEVDAAFAVAMESGA